MKLADLKIEDSAYIDSIHSSGELKQHFLDMGIIPGALIKFVKEAPMGDPMEFSINGYELTLRKDDAKKIDVHLCEILNDDLEEEITLENNIKYHPRIGEKSNYLNHVSSKITFALAGNQNCGKTTLFNDLTGANQHVGNFPGVTVDRKSGFIKNNKNLEVVDLPGIYSLSPYSQEEIVSREFILKSHPQGIINIVDATNIERNLYLTMQLMELDTPLVLALNMMDEVRGNHGSIDINAMEAYLGIPVVAISASKKEGIDELLNHAINVASEKQLPLQQDFCDVNDNQGSVHKCIHSIMALIEEDAKKASLPLRFATTKLIEGDKRVIEALEISKERMVIIESIISQMEKERNLDRASAIADMRYSFIKKLVKKCVKKPKTSKERIRSQKIDQVLTGKYTALPMFILIMGVIFYLTFDLIGGNLQKLLELGITSFSSWITSLLTSWHVNDTLLSLLVDGVINGVGSVLSFIPIIVVLFFFLSLLEDTGYMARIAFVMDKPLRKNGLSGRSIVPLLIGFGCSVPGVMSSRTLPSERDRKLTIILLPFMSCTAKLPIYSYFTNIFFPKFSWLILLGLYFLGILVGIITSLIAKKLIFKGEAVPFVMELPNYRTPGAKNVIKLLWEKAKDFLQKAFTIILLASLVIWFLQTFDYRFNVVSDSSTSLIASLAGFIAPIFKPLGFGDYRIVTALISGFMAKESIVSTLNILFASTDALKTIITPLSCISLLVFCLLYTPCIAAINAIRKEINLKWAMGIVLFQCVVAWIVSFIIYLILGLIF